MTTPPWFFCCGWWSPWCVLDVLGHRLFPNAGSDSLPGLFGWICDRHDRALLR